MNPSSNTEIDYKFSLEVESGTRKTVFANAILDTSNPLYKQYIMETPQIDAYNENVGVPYARWGATNLEPQRLLTDLARVGLIQQIIEKLTAYTVGNGIVFFKYDEKGNMIELSDSATWLNYFNSTNGRGWFYKSAMEYWTTGNPFSKIIMNNEKKPKPALLVPVTSPWCRWQKQDLTTMNIEFAYISAQFGKFPVMTEGDTRMTKVKALNEFLYQFQLNELKEKEYVIGAYNYTPGKYYYHTLPWHANDIEEYIDVLAAFPKTEKAMFEKSMTVKYTIEVAEEYVAARMGLGDNLTKYKGTEVAKKQAEMSKIRHEIEASLIGAEKQHCTILIPFVYEDNGRGGEQSRRPAVVITPIEDKLQKDAHIPNSQNATGKLFEAFGLDPVLVGSGVLGTSNSLSGGSNKREAELSLQITLNPHRQNILWPMKVFLQQFGFPLDAEIGVRNMIQVTQDLNKTGQQSAINGASS